MTYCEDLARFSFLFLLCLDEISFESDESKPSSSTKHDELVMNTKNAIRGCSNKLRNGTSPSSSWSTLMKRWSTYPLLHLTLRPHSGAMKKMGAFCEACVMSNVVKTSPQDCNLENAGWVLQSKPHTHIYAFNCEQVASPQRSWILYAVYKCNTLQWFLNCLDESISTVSPLDVDIRRHPPGRAASFISFCISLSNSVSSVWWTILHTAKVFGD